MITIYGMSKKFGMVALETVESQYLSGQKALNCSETTAAEIDKEVMRMISEAYEAAKKKIEDNREVMDRIAAFLIEKETITGAEFMKLMRGEKIASQEDASDQPAKEAQEDAASGTVTEETAAGETLAVDTAAEAVSENTQTTQEV